MPENNNPYSEAYQKGYEVGYSTAYRVFENYKAKVDKTVASCEFRDPASGRPISSYTDLAACLRRTGSVPPRSSTPNTDTRTSRKSSSSSVGTGSVGTHWLRNRYLIIAGILLFVGFIVASVMVSNNLRQGVSSTAEFTTDATVSSTPEPSSVPEQTSEPYKATSGRMMILPADECVAPFSIEAPLTEDCFVRLHNYERPINDVGVYVLAGDTKTVNVPAGVYTLYYATGVDWKGVRASDNMVFGEDTQWHTSEEVLRFYTGSGVSVTLYAVYDGNLETIDIDADELPF